MIAIANTPRLRMHQDGFVDRWGCRRYPSFSVASIGGIGCLRRVVQFGDAFSMMDGKAQKLGPKRLLDMLRISRIELVLFRQPSVRPLGRLLFAGDRVQFAKHCFAQVGGCGDVEANGRQDLALTLLVSTADFTGRGSGVRAARADDLLSSRPLPPFGLRSRPDIGWDGLIRSGASRSSSP